VGDVLFKSEGRIGVHQVDAIPDPQPEPGKVVPLQAADGGTAAEGCK
jgi:hypothetical protein